MLSPANLNTLSKSVLTTAEGKVVAARNGLHAFGMRYPLTLAGIALVVGNVVGVVLHV